MKKDKLIYVLGSGFGGGLIGCFANKLNTIFGCVMFGIGVFILTYCCYKAAKK